MTRGLAALWLVGLAVGCKHDADEPSATAERIDKTAAVELVDAPHADRVAQLIAPEVARARRDGKHLVVYVGASWCEPCTRFHAAAAAGLLDADFGDVRFLVFDKDRDDDALIGGGYISQLIPLFAIPRDDGTASGRQIEGSIKGAQAVREIAPRLRALVDGR